MPSSYCTSSLFRLFWGSFLPNIQIIGENSKYGITSGHLTTAVQIRFNHSMYVTFSLLFSSAEGSHCLNIGQHGERGGGAGIGHSTFVHGLDFWSVMKCETIGNEYDLLPDVGSLCCLSISFNWKRVIFYNFSSSVLFEAAVVLIFKQAGSFLRAEY